MFDNNISIKTNNPISDNNLNKPKIKTEQVVPFDVIDPTKVTKPSKQDPSNHTGQNLFNYNPDSVFEKFLNSLKNSPVLNEGAKKLLLNKQFINNNIKSDVALSGLFESFIKSIEMNESEMLDFLKFQQNNYTKFNGEFFDLLRGLLKNNSLNNEYKNILRNFLRSYDCFTSIEETSKSIESSLNNILKNMPEMLKSTFLEMSNKLILDNTKGIDINLNILKNEILPFMGKYISKMNDFGPVRDYVSVLIHNIVRLEAADKNNFADSLDTLFDYIKFNFDVDDNFMDKLKTSLINTYEKSSNVKNNSIDTFLKLIESGVKNSENLVNKGLMEDMTESLMFSHNVHIPLTHMFVPLNYNGMFMFSELWIGKNYDEDWDKKKKSKETSISSHAYKVFLTFDIQNIGYFETVILLKNSKVALDIYVPGNIANYTEQIKQDINNLLDKNNLKLSGLSVKECIKKRKFNEVFLNLTERKSGVDVTI